MAQEKENAPTTFHMSIDDVLRLLSEYGASGRLQTILPFSREAKKRCLIAITLQRGKVIEIKGTTESNHRLDAAEIHQLLKGGVFSWQFQYQSPGLSEQSPSLIFPLQQESPVALSGATIAPRQQYRPEKVNFNSLHPERLRRLYMHFYVLCDGMHTLEHIASLLNLSLSHARQIMESLAQSGYIDISM